MEALEVGGEEPGEVLGEALLEAGKRIHARKARDMPAQQCLRSLDQLPPARRAESRHPLQVLDVRRQHALVHAPVELEDVAEILAVERVVPLVVEIAELSPLGVDRVHRHARFLVHAVVRRARGVREIERIELDQHRPAERHLLFEMLS